MLKTIKNNAMALAVLAIAASSVTLMSFGNLDAAKQSTTTLYFHGSTTSAAQVANPANWRDVTNNQTCGTANIAACSMEVDADDVTPTATPGVNQLDPSRIQLTANLTSGTTHYTPSKNVLASPSPEPIFPTNKQP